MFIFHIIDTSALGVYLQESMPMFIYMFLKYLSISELIVAPRSHAGFLSRPDEFNREHQPLIRHLPFFSAVPSPSSRSWTPSPSTCPPRSSSATCPAKPRRGSTALRASGTRPAPPPPIRSWSSSTTTWSSFRASSADRRGWWRPRGARRPTCSPGRSAWSGRWAASWRSTPWRFCPAPWLQSTRTTWTAIVCRSPSRPDCAPSKKRVNTGRYQQGTGPSHRQLMVVLILTLIIKYVSVLVLESWWCSR